MIEKGPDFLRVYSNLPIPLRKEIIYVDDKSGPISWEVAYIEVSNETELAKQILERLSKMQLI